MIDSNSADGTLKPKTGATPLSTFILAVASGDLGTAEAQLADDVEWYQMPYGQKLTGKQEILPWLKAGAASEKEPEIINDVAMGDWGVLEYWNVGTATQELIEFGKVHGWPFPKDPDSLVGQKYRVAQDRKARVAACICISRRSAKNGWQVVGP
jgi:SnoaL-like domain